MSEDQNYSIGIAPILDRSELEETLRLLRHYGVKTYAHQSIGHIEFFSEAPEEDEVVTPDPVPIIGDEMPGDEQMLFYSTNHFDEMEQALKDAQKPEVVP